MKKIIFLSMCVLVALFLVGCGKEPLAGQAVGKYDGGKDITKESDKIPEECLKLSSILESCMSKNAPVEKDGLKKGQITEEMMNKCKYERWALENCVRDSNVEQGLEEFLPEDFQEAELPEEFQGEFDANAQEEQGQRDEQEPEPEGDNAPDNENNQQEGPVCDGEKVTLSEGEKRGSNGVNQENGILAYRNMTLVILDPMISNITMMDWQSSETDGVIIQQSEIINGVSVFYTNYNQEDSTGTYCIREVN